MNHLIQKLARLVSEGDTDAAGELGIELMRAGYLRPEGKDHFFVRDPETSRVWGGSRGWGDIPAFYKSFKMAANVVKRKTKHFGGTLEIVQVQLTALESTKVNYFEELAK